MTLAIVLYYIQKLVINAMKNPAIDAKIEHLEDTKGLICPLPLLRVKRALNQLNAGEVLAIEATDEGSWLDFKVFCETRGHEMLHSEQRDEVFYYQIKKSAN